MTTMMIAAIISMSLVLNCFLSEIQSLVSLTHTKKSLLEELEHNVNF